MTDVSALGALPEVLSKGVQKGSPRLTTTPLSPLPFLSGRSRTWVLPLTCRRRRRFTLRRHAERRKVSVRGFDVGHPALLNEALRLNSPPFSCRDEPLHPGPEALGFKPLAFGPTFHVRTTPIQSSI